MSDDPGIELRVRVRVRVSVRVKVRPGTASLERL